MCVCLDEACLLPAAGTGTGTAAEYSALARAASLVFWATALVCFAASLPPLPVHPRLLVPLPFTTPS